MQLLDHGLHRGRLCDGHLLGRGEGLFQAVLHLVAGDARALLPLHRQLLRVGGDGGQRHGLGVDLEGLFDGFAVFADAGDRDRRVADGLVVGVFDGVIPALDQLLAVVLHHRRGRDGLAGIDRVLDAGNLAFLDGNELGNCLLLDQYFAADRTVGAFGQAGLGAGGFNSSIGDGRMIGFHYLVAFRFRPLRGRRIAGGMEGHVGGALAESAVANADLAVFNGDIRQTVALAKCVPIDFGYSGRKDDGFQMGTALKRTATYVSNAAADGDAGQAGTAVKRRATNTCDAVGNGDAGQARTAGKRTAADACDAVGNGDAGQAGTNFKSIRTNACDAVGNADAGQAGTAGKRTAANAGDAVGDGDAGQAGTEYKRIAANACDAIGNGDPGQVGTPGKRIFANARDAVGNGDAGQTLALIKRLAANGSDPIRYDHVTARALILHQYAVDDLKIIRAAVVRGSAACGNSLWRYTALNGIKRQVDAPDLRKRGIEKQFLAAFQDDSIPGFHVDIHIRGFDFQGFDIQFDRVLFRHRAGHNKRYDKQRGQQAYPHPFHSHCLQSEMIYRLQNTVTQ